MPDLLIMMALTTFVILSQLKNSFSYDRILLASIESYFAERQTSIDSVGIFSSSVFRYSPHLNMLFPALD